MLALANMIAYCPWREPTPNQGCESGTDSRNKTGSGSGLKRIHLSFSKTKFLL